MRLPILGLLVASILWSCGQRSSEHETAETGHHDAEASDTAPSAAPVIPLEGLRGIRWMEAPPPRAEGAWFPGEAVGDEGAEDALTSPVGGRVASAPFSLGRKAARGTVLLEIESPEQAELLSRVKIAEADLARAEAARAREERLASAGATSASELESARREAEVARAESEAARLALATRGIGAGDRSGRVVVRAPADGAVVRWSVRSGQGVEARQDLGTFQAAAARLVRVDLTPPGPAWHPGDATDVRTSDGRRWGARVAAVPSALSPDTRRLTYRLELAGGELPLPGQPVEVRVPYAVAVILPQAAVQQIEGTWGVFVRSGETATFHPVRRGVELGPDVVVEDGVAPGATVAADGAYLLKSLWLKGRSGGDEHEH